jgi:hypothetical protein
LAAEYLSAEFGDEARLWRVVSMWRRRDATTTG